MGSVSNGVFRAQMEGGQFVRETRDLGEWVDIYVGPTDSSVAREVVGVAYALPHNAFAKQVCATCSVERFTVAVMTAEGRARGDADSDLLPLGETFSIEPELSAMFERYYGYAHLSELGCEDRTVAHCAQRDYVFRKYFGAGSRGAVLARSGEFVFAIELRALDCAVILQSYRFDFS